jgi:hypothetical protein
MLKTHMANARCVKFPSCAEGAFNLSALHNSSDQHAYSELLDETNIDVLDTLHVYPIRGRFWQFPLCNVY